MKKLLSILLLFCYSQGFTQGFEPPEGSTYNADSTEITFPSAYLDANYSSAIVFSVPETFSLEIAGQAIDLPFNFSQITSVSTPDGMSYVCPNNCYFEPNSSGDVLLTGTPTQLGTYELAITAFVSINAGPLGINQDLTFSIPYVAGESYLLDAAFGLTGTDPNIINDVIPSFFINVEPAENIPNIEGCMYEWADNYNPLATIEDDSCILYGCTDVIALNYVYQANIDDGSCEFYNETDDCAYGQNNSYAENNTPLFLPEGWSIFGYTCLEPQNLIDAFSSIHEEIVIVKDYIGNAFLPEWDFNAIGNLEFARGYQIKINNEITNFQFCSTIYGGASQEELNAIQSELALTLESLNNLSEQMEDLVLSYNEEDILYISSFLNSFLLDINNLLDSNEMGLNSISELSENYLTPGIMYLTNNSLITNEQISLIYDILYNVSELIVNQEDGITQYDVDVAVSEVHEMYYGWCESDIDNDGICDVDEVSGCMDDIACNYVLEAEFDDNSCEYSEEGYDCFGICYQDIDEDGICNMYEVYGCSDSLANNYNIEVTDDDGSCFYPNCSNNLIILDGNLSLGAFHAWPAFFSIYSINNDTIFHYQLHENEWNSSFSDTLCLQTECYYYDVAGENISINLFNESDTILTVNNHFNDVYEPDFNTMSSSVCVGETEFEILDACPYPIFVEYNSNAYNYDEELCNTLIVYGCTDNIAYNYNYQANVDDESCQYIFGCMDLNAANYNQEAVIDNQSCEYIFGCNQVEADNYNPQVTNDDGSCIYYGCTDSTAGNFIESANTDDGSCLILGCTNQTAPNFNSDAGMDDGSCLIYGCTLQMFPNYNSEATIGDGSCDMNSQDVYGCTDSSAYNFNTSITIENGTCLSSPNIGDLALGGIIFYIDETGEHGLVAALEDLTEGATDPYGWGLGYPMGCYGEYINGARGTSIGTGYQNTMAIVNHGCSTENGGITAAQAALDAEINGYSDWYLPSFDELYEMYNTLGSGDLEGNIGGFENNWYWSSTAHDYYTRIVNFGDGNTYSYQYMDDNGKVRIIRSF